MSSHARLFTAATAAALLASVAGAATVATFNYTNVPSIPGAGTTFNETVAATDTVGGVRINASLTEVNVGTYGNEAQIELTAPDAQVFAITAFPVNGFVGTITATNFIQNFPVQVASAAGTWTLNFWESYDDGADGLVDANWDTLEFNLESPPEPLACPAGLGTISLANVSSNGAIGAVGNSIATGDFGVVGNVNTIRVNGRFTAFTPSWQSEAYVRATAPGGNNYNLLLTDGFPDASGAGEVTGFEAATGSESGTGTWTFEFYEGYADGVTPDATWSEICFAADLLVNTPPAGTGDALPYIVAADGIEATILTVTVVPGDNPVSTGLGVSVDGTAIGAGTITLLDDGVAPDAAIDNIFTASTTVAIGSVEGVTNLPFTITDLESRSGTGNIEIYVAPPAPGCPAGAATFTVAGAQSDAFYQLPGINTIVTNDFGVAGDVNFFRFAGRATAYAPSWMGDASVAMTSPDGDVYGFNMGGGIFDGTFDFNAEYQLVTPEPGTGLWTLEFYEDFDDNVSPETTYSAFCVAIEGVTTSPLTYADAVTPFNVVRDGVQTAVVEVQVVAGALPTSTNLTVIVDDSSIGGSGALALLDDGNFPDEFADDNIFTGTITVAYTTPLGAATLPYVISDDESRTGADALDLNVIEATGACCTESGCVVTTIGDCLDTLVGTYAGTGTNCGAPAEMTADGGAFEDISATGSLVTFAISDDDDVTNVTLPFAFNYFGVGYTDGYVSTNGNFQFGANNSAAYTNGLIPSAGVPNNALYVMWDDFNLGLGGGVYTEMLGTIGVDARFIIQWNGAPQYNAAGDSSTFQIALFEDGSFEFRYLTVSPESVVGDTTTFGFEDVSGTVAVTLAETRDSLSGTAPVSYRGNSTVVDAGTCGNGCAPCAADFDNNGGIDGADLGAFFAAYEAGEVCGDVDQNGGIDGADLAFFFSVYEAGGC